MKTKCDWCGAEYDLNPYRYTHSEFHFCSRSCYYNHKARNQIKTTCFRCGKEVVKSPSLASERSFCSQQCLMKTMNEELNPTRMTSQTKEKLRNYHLGKGDGKSYTKTYSRHTHRIVAEQILGRLLLPGEVVHHIDGNKRNNDPKNLMVFASQKDHATFHQREKEKRNAVQTP